MEKNTARVLAIAVIIAVVVAAIAIFVFVIDKEKYDYAEYTIGGSTTTGYTVEGSMKMELLDETSTQYKMRVTTEIYLIGGGTTVTIQNDQVTRWEDKDPNDTYGTYQKTDTIGTNWGLKTVEIYRETNSDGYVDAYVSPSDGVLYKMVYVTVISGQTLTMTFTLTDTNLL
ncbi:MAG: hypothetical protein LBV13_03555 [Methanomassiliicoccaceae archaeon]|jgi:hypothetical protein|nr:hypothetical protein [Methanomassiliicoccaceae archaeon]